MLPGIEPRVNTTIFHGVNQCIERTSASALLAFVGTCQTAIFFAEENLFALLAALDISDEIRTVHLSAPSFSVLYRQAAADWAAGRFAEFMTLNR